MKDIKLTSFFRPIVVVFKKYSLTIFIVVLVGGLTTAVIILNNALQKSYETSGYTTSTDVTTFDQATINRVNQLHTSSGPATGYTAPAGRINPFSE